MTTNPQIERMAEAIHEECRKMPNPIWGIGFQERDRLAQAAYDASGARLVPMLVIALKAISPKYDLPTTDESSEFKCAVYEKIAQKALAQIPKEYL